MRTAVKVPATGDGVEVPPGGVIVGTDGEGQFIIEVPDKQSFPTGLREWSTGAVRGHDDDKTNWSLLPFEELERVVRHTYMRGAKSLAELGVSDPENNWRKGIPSSAYLASLMRHVIKFKCGMVDEDHLGHATFNILGILYNERVFKDNPEINDLPGWEPG